MTVVESANTEDNDLDFVPFGPQLQPKRLKPPPLVEVNDFPNVSKYFYLVVIISGPIRVVGSQVESQGM